MLEIDLEEHPAVEVEAPPWFMMEGVSAPPRKRKQLADNDDNLSIRTI